MTRELRVVTVDGQNIVVKVNAGGFVQITDGKRTKAQALISFARAFLANPSAAVVEPAEMSAKITLADGSKWVLHADTLLITQAPAEEAVSPTVVETAAEQLPQGEQVVRALAAQASENGGESVMTQVNGEAPTKVGRKARIKEALRSILASQGLSEEQIAEILNQLDGTDRRQPREKVLVDPNTPEGKLYAAFRQLHRQLQKSRCISASGVLGDGFRYEYSDGKLTVFYNEQVLFAIQ